MSQKRDRTTGLPLPNPVDPGSTVCYTMQIPNASEYRQALRGVLAELGKAYNWSQTEGQSSDPANEAAQLWRVALNTGVYDDCEEPMSCADVANCIETDTAVQEAIQTLTGNSINDRVVVPATYPPGTPNPTPDYNLATGTNPTCNLDILWAQCLAITQNTNLAIVDVLQKIEVTSNAAELLDALTEVPLIGWAKEALGGQAALDLINYYQEAVEEQYIAQYTETPGGVQDTIACAIFCACKDDCEITINRLYDVLKLRVEVYVTVPTLATFEDLIDFVAGLSQDNTMVVDAAFFFAWGAIKFGSFFFGRPFDITLSMLLQLSVNDANNDWETLCVDCLPPPVENCLSFSNNGRGWQPDASDYGVITSTGLAGVLFASDGNYYFRFRAPGTFAGVHSQIKLKFNQPIANIKLLQGTAVIGQVGATAASELVATEFTHDPSVNWPFQNISTWNIRVTGDTVPATFRITEICTIPG